MLCRIFGVRTVLTWLYYAGLCSLLNPKKVEEIIHASELALKEKIKKSGVEVCNIWNLILI